jgi:hypothetical protein
LLDGHADGLTVDISEQHRGVLLTGVAADVAVVAPHGAEGQRNDDATPGGWQARVAGFGLDRLE